MSAQALFLMGRNSPVQLIYDVGDPLHPRLVCSIRNTSAHLYTGDTFTYLKPVSAQETDVMLHSLGSGNESVIARFPFEVTAGQWSPDGEKIAYLQDTPTSSAFGEDQVWFYEQGHGAAKQIFTFPIGIGDCICRFGLPPRVLAMSADGQYLAAGWLSGKGSGPLHVIRMSDFQVAYTASQDVADAIWSRSGHELFMFRLGGPTAETWSPEAGLKELNAMTLERLAGMSPDGSAIAYTSDSDGGTPDVPPRVFVYDIASGAARMLVDSMRTQAVFVKDGWVWYLEELPCTLNCAGATTPSGKVFAMRLAAGTEQPVAFAAGEAPLSQPDAYWPTFGPGECWPFN